MFGKYQALCPGDDGEVSGVHLLADLLGWAQRHCAWVSSRTPKLCWNPLQRFITVCFFLFQKRKRKKKKTAEFLPSPFQRDSVRKRGPELPCPTPLPFPWQNREWDRADFYSPWEPLAPFAELVQWHMMTGIIVFHTPAILAHNWLFISNPRSWMDGGNSAKFKIIFKMKR